MQSKFIGRPKVASLRTTVALLKNSPRAGDMMRPRLGEIAMKSLSGPLFRHKSSSVAFFHLAQGDRASSTQLRQSRLIRQSPFVDKNPKSLQVSEMLSIGISWRPKLISSTNGFRDCLRRNMIVGNVNN